MYNIIDSIKTYLLSNGMEIVIDLLILVIGIWVAKVASNITKKAMIRSKVNQTLALFVGNVVYYAIVIFVVLSFLERLGIKTTSFLALIGAAGLAIALALQGSLANFAAGLMIIMFRPFELGDKIETVGVSGVVEEIQIFSTVLITADHKRKIIPNSKITGDVISVEIKH
ncbi:hypothetical protein A3K48_02055 [candidate division WOR-1 bacterium RIFOXYA12_FULL_52_29]|uniref:Mechanosensitive ion channel protein n=1 Tax=candidate division WOR-1 bacterium RIFOXYC12_FULL_54_18 TaxID=1802584 RepID=A0A1F4T5K9_UNCSA|nr:MAG: hypothetical protein A3K44_02055 [candidate division WOR-1 bacterium RIFOXYA2_FULL_51_19]OGC17362.1 MAG: hypothetical protein A3K48_02055 [candidate division WOR-1 bacterium RIFOXYA12_FULL_52_29]OGC26221.1 MAG: hypothetical protein A3K32_02050 [candidate division WOR-1 bacterium RIFOXYB2_FULL_45_9]OGC27779.1 MAG: hypothetical protein A3K49_02055 [candidate division WOR-1 bacterium RIFOXYC12_FULL_54_18]OGC29932.1 MAG: hypothetical protein A2346_04280 [candidate division WOR-1 bacterium R